MNLASLDSSNFQNARLHDPSNGDRQRHPAHHGHQMRQDLHRGPQTRRQTSTRQHAGSLRHFFSFLSLHGMAHFPLFCFHSKLCLSKFEISPFFLNSSKFLFPDRLHRESHSEASARSDRCPRPCQRAGSNSQGNSYFS